MTNFLAEAYYQINISITATDHGLVRLERLIRMVSTLLGIILDLYRAIEDVVMFAYDIITAIDHACKAMSVLVNSVAYGFS